jgi:hypothetical protein
MKRLDVVAAQVIQKYTKEDEDPVSFPWMTRLQLELENPILPWRLVAEVGNEFCHPTLRLFLETTISK